MRIRPRTTLSGFGLMLLADAARVFGLREDAPSEGTGAGYEFRSREEFDQVIAESRARMARRGIPVGAL